MNSSSVSIALSSLGIVLILATLTLLTIAVQNAEQFNVFYRPLLFLSLIGLVVVLLVIGVTFYHIYQQRQRGLSGSKLQSKLISLFIISSVLPLVIIYAFSVKLLNSGIDSWFDIRISEALNNSYELGQTALDERKKRLLREVHFTVNSITTENIERTLFEMLQNSKADEISAITDNGSILAFNHIDPATLVPSMPDESTMAQVKSGATYHELETVAEDKRHIRIVVPIPAKIVSPSAKQTPQNTLLDNNGSQAFLNALFPVPERIEELLANVNHTSSGFRQISFLQPQLRQSMVITLSMVLFIALIASIWLAFYLARRLSQPIMQLANATQEIAGGNYQQSIHHTREDELGFLVDSFNQMSHKIDQSQQQIKGQHAYLDTMLSNMSSGVITINHAGELQRYNQAAEKILSCTLAPVMDKPLHQLIPPHLQELLQCIQHHLDNENWEEELTLSFENHHTSVRLRAQSLSDHSGTIIVIDDITGVIQGQRNAAWSEVAQRLAHEIKNPLTPIQLSADRIRTKCIPADNDTQTQILDKSTHTIIAQVESLKHMVEEFSEYARAPQLQTQSFALPQLLDELAELYRGMPHVHVDIQCSLVELQADPSKLRQVLHNLIKNAMEASNNDVTIRINAKLEAPHTALLTLCDNAGGIAEDILPQVFEPYVTNKTKGTGIGLAIVKRIIEEHGGSISAQNQADGVCFTLRLPQQALQQAL